jgi:hypothetical protein
VPLQLSLAKARVFGTCSCVRGWTASDTPKTKPRRNFDIPSKNRSDRRLDKGFHFWPRGLQIRRTKQDRQTEALHWDHVIEFRDSIDDRSEKMYPQTDFRTATGAKIQIHRSTFFHEETFARNLGEGSDLSPTAHVNMFSNGSLRRFGGFSLSFLILRKECITISCG